jgi:hypothetical protein
MVENDRAADGGHNAPGISAVNRGHRDRPTTSSNSRRQRPPRPRTPLGALPAHNSVLPARTRQGQWLIVEGPAHGWGSHAPAIVYAPETSGNAPAFSLSRRPADARRCAPARPSWYPGSTASRLSGTPRARAAVVESPRSSLAAGCAAAMVGGAGLPTGGEQASPAASRSPGSASGTTLRRRSVSAAIPRTVALRPST